MQESLRKCCFCHKNPVSDEVTELCEVCNQRLFDAINDTLPNFSPEYNHDITQKEKDEQIDALGSSFGFSPEKIREIISYIDLTSDNN